MVFICNCVGHVWLIRKSGESPETLELKGERHKPGDAVVLKQ